MNRARIVIFCLLFAFWLPGAKATTPPLEREISLVLSNEPVKSALAKIQEQTGLIFSYRPSLIEGVSPITLQLKHKTVREALALILPPTIGYKAKNNYVILKEKPLEKNPKKTELSGYVVDKNTDRKVPNVTIYDQKTLKAVTTDEFGYYSINVPNENQCLKVNKENYRDTCVPVAGTGQITNIAIDRLSDSIIANDSVDWRSRFRDFSRQTNDLFKKFKGYVNTLNVKDTLARNFQVSLLPFVGSNGLLSGNVYNKYSLNIFGGYSRGTHRAELGGFFNVNKEEMHGVQLAGFFNVVGDSAEGTQLAGFFNVTGRNMSGVQAAGFFNCNIGDVSGFQGAGFLNFNRKGISGVQAAGFANLNYGELNGVSAAGLANLNRFSVTGVQVAGLMNLAADTLNGASLAGLLNVAWYGKNALQVSGLFNYARSGENNVQVSALANATHKGSTSLQVSALLNRAHVLTGCQLGAFNYADSASGVPIGFLSFVKKGTHQVELFADELFYTNIGIRTGVPAFYNLLSLSLQPGRDKPFWGLGYGIGTSFKIGSRLNGDFSATASHISSGQFYHATSELYRFYAGFEYRFFKKFSIAAGPTFNLYWSDALLPDYNSTYSQVAPYYSFNKSLPYDFNLKGWFGGRIAFRFF